MESYQIIAGFSDIKSELRTKAKIVKPLAEIQLWFCLDDDALYASNGQTWKFYLNAKRPGGRLLRYIMNTFAFDEIQAEIKGLYVLHGFF